MALGIITCTIEFEADSAGLSLVSCCSNMSENSTFWPFLGSLLSFLKQSAPVFEAVCPRFSSPEIVMCQRRSNCETYCIVDNNIV